MGEISTFFQKLFQPGSGLGLVVLFVLVSLLGIAAYRLNYTKTLDSNGKVIHTRKLHSGFWRFLSTSSKSKKKTKPFSPVQKRLLSIMYSLHEALFGLIIFAFGLGLVTKVFFDLVVAARKISDPMIMTCALLGIIAMPVGVLLIYYRNADNPFDET